MIRPCYGKRRYLSKQPSVVRTRAREKAHDLHGKRPEGARRSVPRQAARSHSAHRPSMFGADAREERGGKRGTVLFSLACVQFRVDVCPVEPIKANNQLLLQPQGPQHRLIGGAVGLKGQRRAQANLAEVIGVREEVEQLRERISELPPEARLLLVGDRTNTCGLPPGRLVRSSASGSSLAARESPNG